MRVVRQAISREGEKTQRKASSLSVLLCVFAPSRDTFFRKSIFNTDGGEPVLECQSVRVPANESERAIAFLSLTLSHTHTDGRLAFILPSS